MGHTIGGIVAGIEQQIFRTTPPVNELVARGAPIPPVASAGGGTLAIRLPGEPGPTSADRSFLLSAPGANAVVDLDAGGRLASFVVDGWELLVTAGQRAIGWGSFPMAPFAGRVRDGRFSFRGRDYQLPTEMPPHAIHGTVLGRRWERLDERSIVTDLGPTWPFAGQAIQRFDLQAGRFTSQLEVHAAEPMPASIGWHPWFRRHPGASDGRPDPGPGSLEQPGPLELDLDAGAMFRRDATGIATQERLSPPPPPPWDDCFTDLRRPPRLTWPGYLELTIESDCPAWVVYTVPPEALCVEPQTAPPDALNTGAAIVEPGRPLIAEMVWTWRSLGGSLG